MKLKRN